MPQQVIKPHYQRNPEDPIIFATDGKNLIASWLDNKVVTCATYYVNCNPVSTAQRWSKSVKKRADVPIPKSFEDYNNQMGAVDLLDQFVSKYRVRSMSKKWQWSCFEWSVNASMTNAWELFRTGQKQKIGMLEFQRLS